MLKNTSPKFFPTRNKDCQIFDKIFEIYTPNSGSSVTKMLLSKGHFVAKVLTMVTTVRNNLKVTKFLLKVFMVRVTDPALVGAEVESG
jgi:hypothetical protein